MLRRLKVYYMKLHTTDGPEYCIQHLTSPVHLHSRVSVEDCILRSFLILTT
jgi:hypothetical protein